MYRVVRYREIGFRDPQVSESVFWKGADPDELSIEYPPSEIFGADRLGHSELEDGLIRIDYRFEQLVNGEWLEIEDPRRRPTAILTELEREIDAENRRRFPGDYDDRCDCGYRSCGCDYDDRFYDGRF